MRNQWGSVQQGDLIVSRCFLCSKGSPCPAKGTHLLQRNCALQRGPVCFWRVYGYVPPNELILTRHTCCKRVYVLQIAPMCCKWAMCCKVRPLWGESSGPNPSRLHMCCNECRSPPMGGEWVVCYKADTVAAGKKVLVLQKRLMCCKETYLLQKAVPYPTLARCHMCFKQQQSPANC